MNNTKTTKRALLSSVMAMFICVAMLIGTTFAWFTDSASTAVNKIQAGTLKVGLEMKDASNSWVNAEGETLSWKKAATAPAGEMVLWEPGCTYELPLLKITNLGNLETQFQVQINGITGTDKNGQPSTKLLDALNFEVVFLTDEEYFDIFRPDQLAALTSSFGGSYLNNLPYKIGIPSYITQSDPGLTGIRLRQNGDGGDTYYVRIRAHMDESANNDYQGLSLDNIGITVVATQLPEEYDSFGNQYDANAEYPVVVSSQTAFSETVAASENSNIVLSAGTYTLPAAANKTVAISGTKDTVIDLTSTTGQSLSGTDLTFENVTVKGINSDYVGIQHSGDIVYNNVTFNDSTTLYGESVTFNNCTFNLSSRYIWTYGAKEVTFNNCTFNTDGKAILIYAEEWVDSQTVNVNGCTFNATETGHTFSGDACAAVEIDASLITGRYTVNFTGTNTVDPDFNGIYRIKNNSASKVTINGIN